jgi:hypothetical protein
MVNMAMMCNDLLNDWRPDLRLRWRRWRWKGFWTGGPGTLLLAPNDYFVLDHLALRRRG